VSGQVEISHFDVVDLGIPWECLGIYHINRDVFCVDKRRVRRHIRRARERECSQALRDWRRRRLNAMERRL
jgi:hypothetical protein